MKKILVTGTTGFVGGHLTPCLRDSFDVIGVVRHDGKSTDITYDIQQIPTDIVTKKMAFADQVIHLASLTAKSKDDNQLSKAWNFFAINVTGTLNLLAGLSQAKLTHMIYVSTLDVYGDTKGKTITEKTPTLPATNYGASKLAAEHVCRIWCQEKGIPLAIARLGIVYGPGEEAYQKAIPNFIRQAVAGKSLTICGKGIARRDLIYVDDVASALQLLAQKKTEGIVNIVSGTSVTINHIAKTINRLTKNTKGITYIKNNAAETSITFDVKKLKALGFSPSVSLEEGLRLEIYGHIL